MLGAPWSVRVLVSPQCSYLRASLRSNRQLTEAMPLTCSWLSYIVLAILAHQLTCSFVSRRYHNHPATLNDDVSLTKSFLKYDEAKVPGTMHVPREDAIEKNERAGDAESVM